MATMFEMSVTAPSSPTDGKVWFQPEIPQVYMYINGAWRPWVGGVNTITFDVGLNIFIRGNKRNVNIFNETFEKQDNLTYRIDTCTFTMWDDDGTLRPSQGDEVQIFYKADVSSDADKIFGGEITAVPQIEYGPGVGRFRYEVEAHDYSIRMKKNLVVQDYTSQTAQFIIQDIIDTYAPEFSYNNVETGPTINFISFNYKEVDQCIKEIAQLSGFDWYVDEDRDIHFFQSVTNIAPFTITDDTSTSGNNRDLIIEVDKSQYRNRITVQGGFFFSGDTDEITSVVTTDEELWYFAYKPFAAASGNIEIYVDAGGGFVQKTIGIDNIVTSGVDFLINQNEKTLKKLDYVPVANDKIKRIYQYKIPILTEDNDTGSQDTIKAIEGGDGIYEFKITDENIKTIQAAHDRAKAELNQYANPIIMGSYRTKDDGYRSGQLLTINAPSRGTNADNKTYLIQSVTTRVIGGNTLEYDIIFATRLKGLIEFLTELYDNSAIRDIIVREDETLDVLVIPTEEELVLSDSAEDVNIGLPYEYGPGGDRQGVYEDAITSPSTSTGIYG
jgi:hypothetical protein